MRWVVLVGMLLACQAATTSPYDAVSSETRNTVQAQELSRRAADLIDEHPEKATELLREALSADLFFGPAHNNLGVLYLKEGKLYEAANEFEWARKLMPGHPDPRMNLALTLEKAGQVDEAIRAYETALEVYPGYLPAIQGLASLTIRAGMEDERLAGWLDEIALRAQDPAWRRWAQAQGTCVAAIR